MKVVLSKDVDGLGTAGDVVDVANGYARNHLIPNGIALRAAGGTLTQAESMARARAVRNERDRSAAEHIAQQLVAAGVTVTARASESGQLYGSVTVADICDAIETTIGVTLDRKSVNIAEPIRSVGTHDVNAEPHPEVKIAFVVEVVAAE